MSADEFDPDIERLFNRTPGFPDTDAFARTVETRLASGSRLRRLALTGAGVIGGVIAVGQALSSNLSLTTSEQAVDNSLAGLAVQAQSQVQAGAESMGLGGIDLSGMGGMQLFWLVTAGIVGVAVLGVTRLSQEI